MSRIFCRDFRIRLRYGNSTTHLCFPSNRLPFNVLLFAYPKQNERPFLVSYLIHSLGLSPEFPNLITQDRPDSLLSLVKDYGFTISRFHVTNPAKTLVPKLEFGVSSSDLLKFVCSNPILFSRISPYNMLKSILESDKEVIQSLRNCVLHMNDMYSNLSINIALLRKLKVPQENLSYLLNYCPTSMFIDPTKFSDLFNKVIQLGLHPSKFVVSRMSYKAWEHKMEVFRRLSLSEEQILFDFKKFPSFMTVSVKKITSTMNYIMNKMGYQVVDVVCNPTNFSYSLENRIIPRFSILMVLQSKGLVKTGISISSVVAMAEKNFLNATVINHREGEIPEFLSIYQGNMSTLGLGCRFEAERHIAG